MSTDAKLPGAREVAHKFCSDEDWIDDCPEDAHGLDCDRLTAAIEARDAALRSAVVGEAVDVVKRLLSFAEYVCDKANDTDIVEDEDIARAGDIFEATAAWLATRTGGNENE